jgi:hypothetical protein
MTDDNAPETQPAPTEAAEAGRDVERWPNTRAGRVVALLMGLSLVGWLSLSMLNAVRDAAEDHDNDYEAFAGAARALLNGEDVLSYSAGPTRPFLCLPWFAVFMVPFAVLGYTVGGGLWIVLNIAGLIACSWWCLRMIRGPDAPLPWPLLVLPPLFVLRALDSNFSLGQVNIVTLFFATLGVWLYLRRRPFSAGLALSLAALIKVYPGLLCAYFLWKRQWRVVAGCIVGGIILVFIVPMPFYGPAGGFTTAYRWANKRIMDRAERVEQSGYVPGQSLRPMAYRFLTDSTAYSHSDEDIRVNVLSLPPRTAEWVFRATALALLAALVAVTWGRGDPGDWQGTALEVSLVMAAMLLATPFNRKAHFVLLMLPMTLAYSRVALHQVSGRRRLILLGGLLVCGFLTVCTAEGLLGDTLSDYLTALTCMGWGTLALFAALALTRN